MLAVSRMSRAITCRLQSAAAPLSTSTASFVRKETDSNPADPPFVFRPGCGGKRELSKEARELRER